MDAYSCLHFDELENVCCSAWQCSNISVSTAPLLILSPVNDNDQSQNTFLCCEGYSAYLRIKKNQGRSFSYVAEHLSPSLRQEEHVRAKESLYTISRKSHIIRFWIDMDF